MNKSIILTYIDKLKKEDIIAYANKQNIILLNDEIDLIYNKIKSNSNDILNNPYKIIESIKDKIRPNIYDKIIELYNKYKYFITI